MRAGIVLREVEGFERNFEQYFMAGGPRGRHRGGQGLAIGRKGQRRLVGQFVDGVERALFVDPQARDDDGDLGQVDGCGGVERARIGGERRLPGGRDARNGSVRGFLAEIGQGAEDIGQAGNGIGAHRP
ncbi:hypothetical protein D3C87_1526820 [compost metagenome]